MRFAIILTSLIYYITLSAAWPWPANLFLRDSSGHLVVRDDPPPSSSLAAPASSASQGTASNTGTATGSSAPSGTNSGSAAPSSKPTGKPDDDDNKNKTTTSSISIDPESPAGGLSMVNPPATTTTYYKYGTNITWIWNYTSLVVTPSAVDVLVSCSDTASTFTVAQNVSVNATQTIIWDTSKETGAGITDKYTLAVYNADDPAGVSQTASPGKFAVYNQFTFGMYTPQPYQGIGDGYRCVTCNGANAAIERQALGVMMTMVTITVLSFTFFAGGFMSV